MPIQGEYMGMMLTIDDVDKENREFFRHCAEGTSSVTWSTRFMPDSSA